jgi:predicted dehydrogenase
VERSGVQGYDLAVRDDVVRLGLAGVGRWGRNYIRTVRKLDGVGLSAVASRNPETPALLPAGCAVFSDWRDLISSTDVDAVIVATPPTIHAEIVVVAARAGKPVLVEKPLTMGLPGLAQIRAAVGENGPLVVVGHTHLYQPAFVQLCAEVAARGPVRAIRSSAGNHGPYRLDAPVLWDWGPHDIAMCLALHGEPLSVIRAERLDARLVEGIVAERICLDLRSGNDVTISTTLSTLDDKHRWFAVDTDDATLIYSDAPAKLTLYDRPGARSGDAGTMLPVTRDEAPLTVLVRQFAEAVRSGSTDRDGLILAERVVECLAACESMLGPVPPLQHDGRHT